ncbi:MAG: TetR family transcriptional regulator [Actinomycetota bacterium]|nr:TetR family transcriptional regulator [Actinomycetota bacterium]
MSMPYESGGRTGQKRRTRDALVAAARDQVSRGLSPSVEEAAAAAAISRTTAYRYFPNQRSLLAAAHPETNVTSLLSESGAADPAARLDDVMKTFTKLVIDTEAQQRTMLRLSLEADPAERAALPLRQGRAIGWIAEALEPLADRMTEAELLRLVLAIRSATGIEALVWLTDVADVSRADAVELMRWSAQSLLRAAVTDGPPPI